MGVPSLKCCQGGGLGCRCEVSQRLADPSTPISVAGCFGKPDRHRGWLCARRSALSDAHAAGNPVAIEIRSTELKDLAYAMCGGRLEDFNYCLQVIDMLSGAFTRMFGKEEILTAKIADGGTARLAAFEQYLRRYGSLSLRRTHKTI